MRPGCLDQACLDQAHRDLWTFLAVVGSGFLIAFVWWFVHETLEQRLLSTGIAADAVITDLQPRGQIRDAGGVKIDVTLLVTAPSGAEFRSWTTERFPITELPQVGWTVPVRYSARDHHRIVIAGRPTPPRCSGADLP